MTMVPGTVSPDNLDDALAMMEPLYISILEAVKNILPGDPGDDDVKPYIMAVMGALAKATAAIIDSVYDPSCFHHVLRHQTYAIMGALQMFQEEDSDLSENK